MTDTAENLRPTYVDASVDLDASTREALTRFVLLEARLADDHEYEPWLDLWHAEGDIRYWVPVSYAPGDEPSFEHNVILDDRAKLTERVFRLAKTSVHAQDPPSVVQRVVSPPEPLSRDGDLLHVGVNFFLMELRGDRQQMHAGRNYFALTNEPDFRIVEKTVVLARSHDAVHNLVFLL